MLVDCNGVQSVGQALPDKNFLYSSPGALRML